MKPEEILQKLEPVLGTKVRSLYVAWMLADKLEKQEIEQHINLLYIKHLQPEIINKRILLPPPLQQISNGEIPIGQVLYNDKKLHTFSLRKNELSQHIAIFGRSGSGKTNTVRTILRALIQQKIPFLIFDWKKDYSQMDFQQTFPNTSNNDFLVLPIGKPHANSLRINPLIPPQNTPLDVWSKKLCETLTHAYLGGPGFESIFLKAIDHCYKEYNTYETNTSYPTFLDVKEYIESMSYTGREALWMQSVMRTISSICYGGMNQTINHLKPMDINELLTKNVILEMEGISNNDKTFLIETILLWIHHHKLEHPPNNNTENIIIIEEAHHLLRKNINEEETLIENSIREMRSLGIGIIIVDQMPSLISKVALANTYCTIALNVKTGQDVHTLSQAMLLDDEQKEILGTLPVGQAIIKLQDRHTQPFHTQIPHINTGKQRIIHYQPPPQDSNGLSNIPQQQNKNKTTTPTPTRPPPQINKEKNNTKNTTTPENELLKDIAKNPTDPITTRYKRLNLSIRKGNNTKNQLIKQGLITPTTITSQNAWIRLFTITTKGKQQLTNLNITTPSPAEGSLEHQYWKQKITEHYTNLGYQTEQEHKEKNHTVDIIATKEDENIAIEIETGKSNYAQNIINNLANKKHTTILILCTNKHIKNRITNETQGINDPRLQIKETREV
jgi:hypothetical protein